MHENSERHYVCTSDRRRSDAGGGVGEKLGSPQIWGPELRQTYLAIGEASGEVAGFPQVQEGR